MTDERYCFISDVREKKSIGRGAYHKRSHAGKGGAVKFPSDYMTKKELKAMNGVTKSYNINNPMSWDEFKAMPDDIKVIYIKAVRDKFHVANTDIAKMFGVHPVTMQKHFARLGIGHESRKGKTDKEGWCRWVNGVPAQEEPVEEVIEEPVEEVVEEPVEISVEEPVEEVSEEACCGDCSCAQSIPVAGRMDFKGDASAALETMKKLLRDSNVMLDVRWRVIEDD